MLFSQLGCTRRPSFFSPRVSHAILIFGFRNPQHVRFNAHQCVEIFVLP
jgi:hypothetical protein